MTSGALAGRSGQPVIIGAGLAGLACALSLAPQPVIVVTKTALGDGCSSVWAQGGIAAALGADDSAALHIADTLAAGDGLCVPEAVERIITAAPQAIAALEAWGVRFDRDGEGRYCGSLEAAHSRRRVLHAGGGDTAGRSIMAALIERVQATPSIHVLEETEITRLITRGGVVRGVVARVAGQTLVLPTGRVVLATGGIGGLWPHSTNPSGAVGQGLALAALAGARIADSEFVQFHPTAVDIGRDPMPLASEALRGEGARLVDDAGRPIVRDDPRGDLAPRDVVARAVWQHCAAGGQVFLDGRDSIGAGFPERFPTLYGVCIAAGIDPVTTPIPVRPGAHYHMGGVAVDAAGRSTLAGLWACGEAAATGLHGANRLASNSLLEAVVTGQAVAADLVAQSPADRSPALLPVDASEGGSDDPAATQRVRAIMGRHVGILRSGEGLAQALAALRPDAERGHKPAVAALLVAAAAYLRTESRGAQSRSDFPAKAARAERRFLTLADALNLAARCGDDSRLAAGVRP